MATTTHKATFKVETYGYGGYTSKITYTCSCGKVGTISDSARRPVTLRIAARLAGG